MKHFILFLALFFCLLSSVQADTLDIKVGQKPMKLSYWRAQRLHFGGVIIIKGGEPPQWSDFLAELAQKLAKSGWSTVLLNCSPESSSPWPDQLPEAISALRQDKNNRIVLLHYGEQLKMSMEYLSKPQAKGINGLVLLSGYDDPYNDTKPPPQPADKTALKAPEKPTDLRFSVLDLIGQFDYEPVLNQQEAREKEPPSAQYLSISIPGAHHDYEYSQPLLVSFINGWMQKLPEINPQDPPIAKPGRNTSSYLPPIHSLESYLVAVNAEGQL